MILDKLIEEKYITEHLSPTHKGITFLWFGGYTSHRLGKLATIIFKFVISAVLCFLSVLTFLQSVKQNDISRELLLLERQKLKSESLAQPKLKICPQEHEQLPRSASEKQ